MATSGPGATNLVTGIATARLDSSPILCITGQVPSGAIGTDAFQEVDFTGITLPITKHSYLITRPEDIAGALKEALYIANSGRPGPVLVDISKDAQQGSCDFEWDDSPVRLPGYRPDLRALPEDFEQSIELINGRSVPSSSQDTVSSCPVPPRCSWISSIRHVFRLPRRFSAWADFQPAIHSVSA